MSDELKIYTVMELAKLFHLTPQTVRKYLKEGKIKGKSHQRIFGKRLI